MIGELITSDPQPPEQEVARELHSGFADLNLIWNMTRPEQCVYLAGLRQLNEQETDAMNDGEHPKGQPRDTDMEMMCEMERDLQQGTAG